MNLKIIIVPVFIFCMISVTYGFNFNIFRWPSFNRPKKIPRPLQGLSRFKSQAFTGLRGIKGPIVRGIRNLYDFKKNLLSHVTNKGNKGGGSSSYFRRPPSSYGGGSGGSGGGGYSNNNDNDNDNGFFEIAFQGASAPSSGYGAPQSPSTSYGAPQSPSTSYGAPQSPSTSYGAPQGGTGSGTGFNGFSPSQQIGNNGVPVKQTAPQPQPLQNNYEINAPLSAAMAMGHLLNEEEVIGNTGSQALSPTAQWRPIAGLTGTGSAATGGQYNGGNGQTNGLNPTAVAGPTGNLVPRPIGGSAGRDTLLIGNEHDQLDVVGEALSHVADPTLQVSPPAAVSNNVNANQDTLLIGEDNGAYTTPFPNLQPSNLIRGNSFSLNNLSPLNNNNIQPALSPQVQDSQLLIGNNNQQYNNNNNNNNNRGRNLGSRSPQENLVNPVTSDTRVVRQGTTAPSRAPTRTNNNIMFAGLMEELQLNALTTLIRRANLEAMLTTEGKLYILMFFGYIFY